MTGGHRQRAELRGVGTELVERHRNRNDRAGGNLNIGSIDQKSRPVRVIERLSCAVDDFSQIGASPARLQQKVMRVAKGQQAAFDCVLCVLRARRIAKALRRNGTHGCKRVLDAVVKFFQDQLLQLVGGFALLGVDAGLRQQRLGAELGLRQQQPQADIFGCQDLLR